jgi:hypothetical protein
MRDLSMLSLSTCDATTAALSASSIRIAGMIGAAVADTHRRQTAAHQKRSSCAARFAA